MRTNILNVICAGIFFGLFIIGMVFAEEMKWLVSVGILGLSGFIFFIYRIVSLLKTKRT
ncbi:hypothetical protein NC661_10380 [Aquibacillus koreensis]|uniref:Uncharacterized protein n=1 Tax=Aquibacillus koreensis TaxID=279446 RepID=A0A9X4AII4_9BACI|nr:hypothetical protein [Aquibacillus koreensis]MCT2538283.1 hypothetical protein [Aquibacillus koreensis]MDC3420774.1 hypothetical protein [Aquibacillus koreensis]